MEVHYKSWDPLIKRYLEHVKKCLIKIFFDFIHGLNFVVEVEVKLNILLEIFFLFMFLRLVRFVFHLRKNVKQIKCLKITIT